MESQIPNLTLRALRRILRATEISTRQLAAATSLTPSQLLVLREIESRDQPTPGTIAAALHFSQATITSILDRLAALNLVTRQRSEKDKRQFILTPTPEGRAALERAPDMLQMDFQKDFSALPEWEQAMILAAVEKLSVLLGAQGLDAAPLLDGGAIDRVTPQH
ncbi:MAG: MarR family transcriptional regulator [Alphaproteobacteria bacterium]|nr:MarR family transcriptional regulator [Alphaproteobacteria bacterium]